MKYCLWLCVLDIFYENEFIIKKSIFIILPKQLQ